MSPHASKAFVNVATFDQRYDADVLAQVMQEEGIDASVQDERKLQHNWFLVRKPRAGLHVRVPEPEFLTAQKFLAGHPAGIRLANRAVHCPSCHSPRVHFPQMTRKNVLPTLVAQALVLLGVMRQEYYCEACHYTWLPGQSNRNADN